MPNRASLAVLGELQWGHAFVSVETGLRGDALANAEMLQWGHAFVSVETSKSKKTSPAAKSLQWGHAFVSVETRISHRGASIPPFLAPAARSGATSAYFGRLGRDFAGHFPARRAFSPL